MRQFAHIVIAAVLVQALIVTAGCASTASNSADRYPNTVRYSGPPGCSLSHPTTWTASFFGDTQTLYISSQPYARITVREDTVTPSPVGLPSDEDMFWILAAVTNPSSTSTGTAVTDGGLSAQVVRTQTLLGDAYFAAMLRDGRKRYTLDVRGAWGRREELGKVFDTALATFAPVE